MRVNNLKTEQYIAINYLSFPNKAGLTYTEIAKECGVDRRTLHRWRDNPFFDAELKLRMRRNYGRYLPEILEAMANAVIRDGNAAAARLLLQLLGELPNDKVAGGNVQATPDEVNSTLDVIQERIHEYERKRDAK